MTFHAMAEPYEEITVCGKPALFTSIRIKRDTVPDGLYAYDIRHDCLLYTSLPGVVLPRGRYRIWNLQLVPEVHHPSDDRGLCYHGYR